MRLRKLEIRDAERMIEWMHDPYVSGFLKTDFLTKTVEDCIKFISNSFNKTNIHLAIVDENDLYMGTVSLKNIDHGTAEFAITVCKDAMGKGYSIWAMNEIIKMGFEKYRLKEIYWCVVPENLRALHFYDKNKFERVKADSIVISNEYTPDQIDQYIWYRITYDTFGYSDESRQY